MSPKDHKHPEWERKWRDAMADHQSAPATEEDWLSMSALLEGGGVAPPDATPAPGAGGGANWSMLKWLLPVLVTASLATAYWFAPRGEASPNREDMTAETAAPGEGKNNVIQPSDEAFGGQQARQVLTGDPGLADGGSRRRFGTNLASGARATSTTNVSANAPPSTERIGPQEATGEAPTPGEPPGSGHQNERGGVEGEAVQHAASGPPEPTPPERVTRPRRRIPRRMPQIVRDFDPDAIWKKKIERQIANLRVTPQRRTKTDNGLYPRVRVRY